MIPQKKYKTDSSPHKLLHATMFCSFFYQSSGICTFCKESLAHHNDLDVFMKHHNYPVGLRMKALVHLGAISQLTEALSDYYLFDSSTAKELTRISPNRDTIEFLYSHTSDYWNLKKPYHQPTSISIGQWRKGIKRNQNIWMDKFHPEHSSSYAIQ